MDLLLRWHPLLILKLFLAVLQSFKIIYATNMWKVSIEKKKIEKK